CVPGWVPVASVAAFTRVTVGNTAWLVAKFTPSARSRCRVGLSPAVMASGLSPSTTKTTTRCALTADLPARSCPARNPGPGTGERCEPDEVPRAPAARGVREAGRAAAAGEASGYGKGSERSEGRAAAAGEASGYGKGSERSEGRAAAAGEASGYEKGSERS